MDIGLKKQDTINYVLKCFVGLLVGWYFFLCFSFNVGGDEKEHLYASFLIAHKSVPYRDFFEHHHPLMWYMFAPIVLIFENNENVLYAMRLFVLLFLYGSAWYIYKILWLIGANKRVGLFAVILYFCFPIIQKCGIEFRPDNLMMFFYLGGLYYLLKYRKNNKVSSLVLSFLLFFISFMILQKSILLLFIIFMLVAFDIYNGNILFSDVCKSLILPIVLFICFLFYFYFSGSLKDYWELNWLINSKIKYTYSIVEKKEWIILILGNLIALRYAFFSKIKEIKIISLFSLILFFILIYINPPHNQYFLIVYPFLAIILGYALSEVNNIFLLFIFAILVVWFGYNVFRGVSMYPKSPYNFRDYVKRERIILINSDKDDTYIGCEDLSSGSSLRKNIAGYYWFSYVHMVQLDYKFFKRHELPMLNKIIKVKKPKIICGSDWAYCLNDDLEMISPCKTWQYLDKDWVNLHYNKIGSFYIRRD